MNLSISLLFFIVGLLFSLGENLPKNIKEKEITSIDGKIVVSIIDESIDVDLSYIYVATDSIRTSVSFFLAKEMEVKSLEGSNIKGYAYDAQATPFGALTINFSKALEVGEKTDFQISYSGKPSQGFWLEEYQWVDIDPDFMLLPLFSTFEYFTYSLKAEITGENYKLIDLESGEYVSDISLKSAFATYYFNPFWAANSERDGLKFYQFESSGQRANIFTNDADSALFVNKAAERIFDYYHNTFAREDRISNWGVVYRPVPFEDHRTTRSFRPMMVIARHHEQIHTLAHEISHFWWNRGDALTTEKWLSESFAQYSEMMFMRHELGQDYFNKEIKRLAKISEKLPPLLGGDRFGKHGNNLIYVKGPYLLYHLENMVGQDTFTHFLVRLISKKIDNTTDLLEELEGHTSSKIRKEFEEMLKK